MAELRTPACCVSPDTQQEHSMLYKADADNTDPAEWRVTADCGPPDAQQEHSILYKPDASNTGPAEWKVTADCGPPDKQLCFCTNLTGATLVWRSGE